MQSAEGRTDTQEQRPAGAKGVETAQVKWYLPYYQSQKLWVLWEMDAASFELQFILI